ncbi:gliding motility-associated C-terminal domain-containing protein [Mucilaginibacter sp. NFR10]|nr:gliding motility-associated C-terminal domain-containing protein [Mucilaginibacter sp. NFR10]
MHPKPALLYKIVLWAIFCLFFLPSAGFSRAFENPLTVNTEPRSVEPRFTTYHITVAPLQAITICSAAAAVLNGDIKNTVPDSYLWQINNNGNWVNAPSANTQKDYITSSLTNTSASSIVYSLRRKISIAGVVDYDSYYDVTVRPIAAVNNNTIVAPAVTQFCSTGNPTAITGSAPGGGDGTFSYQWQSSTDNATFNDISGAVSKNYDPPVLNNDTYYRRMVSSGACTTPALSNVVLLKVSTPPPPPSPAASTITICQGTPATLTVASPQAGFTYNWYDSSTKITVLATGTSYTTPVLNAGKNYYVEASNGTCGSQLATIQVKVTLAPAVPQFSQTTVTACMGSTVTLSVQNSQSGVIYNWYSTATDANILHTGSTFVLQNVTSAITYYVEGLSSTGCSSTSRGKISLTVKPVIAVTNNQITAPTVTDFCVTGNPSAITGSTPAGGDGTFSYQWQSSADNITFANIAGATSKSYDPPVLSKGAYYRRIVSSGTCTTPMVSNVISVQVLTPPPAPSPVASGLTICQGTAATLTISSPQAGLTYNWYDSPAKTTILATGTTYKTPVLNAGKSYYVEASNSACSSPLTTIQVTVSPLPAVPQFTQSTVSVCSGSATTITIQNAQSGIVYNWYGSATDANILHTGTSYTISNVTAATTYYVQAVNAAGCGSSARGTVSVAIIPLPVVTVSSSGTSVCPGTSATLTASASGGAVISWYDAPTGGNLLAQGNTYVTANLTSAKNYYLEATNNTGCNSSGRVTVQVQMTKPLDAPVVTVGEVTSSSVAFEWSAVSGATSYLVSTNNGLTYTAPSSGSNGLTHKVSGLGLNESVTITVKALGASSCTLSGASVAVTAATIDNNNVIYVANNFTPNGDGNNDIIYAHGKNIKTLSFNVYDQWGQLVFTSTDVNKGWDGYYKGSLMPVGVYVYYLKAAMNNGAELNKKGTITLLR